MSETENLDEKTLHEELRASEEKYRTLFNSIDEGFCIIEVLFDEKDKPLDYRFLEINAAFERQTGIVNGVGKRMREIEPRHEEHWFEMYGKVALTGEAVRFEHYAEYLGYRWYEVYAFRLGDLHDRRVGILFNDISERKHREANFAFLDEVSLDLVGLSSIDETMNRLGAKIGRFFGVKQCMFAEHTDDFKTVVVSYGWNAEDAPDLKGTYRIRDFLLAEAMVGLRTGKPLVIGETQSDPRVNAEGYGALGIRSFVIVPLVREGEWRFQISIVDNKPRDWRDDEIELMRELTTRTWMRLERAGVERAMRKSEERLRLLIESARGYAIFTTDADGMINSWNPGAAQIFGWRETEILGQNCAILFTPEDRLRDEPAKELGTARTQGIAPDVRWHQRKDGSRVFIDGEVRPMRDGQLNGFLKIGRDLTVQRQAEGALRENQQQLQLLNETLEQQVHEKTAEVRQVASEVINAIQRERERISHVLHDDLQQRIYAVQMQLNFLMDGLPGENEIAQKKTSRLKKELSDIVEITRNLSIDLSPPILPGEGLTQAIDWLTSRMQEQYGLYFELRANGPFIIPNKDLHVLVFNCVRELLFNVVKHAEASRVVVALERIDQSLRIEVSDNGKGLPQHMPDEDRSEPDRMPQSLGLPSIRHQLSLFGGSMEIHSTPGAGTQVILFVPIAQAPPAVSSLTATP